MRPWRNAKIRTKIGLGLVVALLGVASLAAVLVADKRAQMTESAEVRTVAGLSVKVGNLLHETQRERGRTAQFTSARGKAFGTELTAQQAVTDQRLAEYRGYVRASATALAAPVRTALRTAWVRSRASSLA